MWHPFFNGLFQYWHLFFVDAYHYLLFWSFWQISGIVKKVLFDLRISTKIYIQNFTQISGLFDISKKEYVVASDQFLGIFLKIGIDPPTYYYLGDNYILKRSFNNGKFLHVPMFPLITVTEEDATNPGISCRSLGGYFFKYYVIYDSPVQRGKY